MFTTIIEWLVFLTVAGIIAYVVGLLAYGIYAVKSEEGIAQVALLMLGMFGPVFFIIAPFIFSGAIPANNNLAILVGVFCWLVAPVGCVLLSTWASERRK